MRALLLFFCSSPLLGADLWDTNSLHHRGTFQTGWVGGGTNWNKGNRSGGILEYFNNKKTGEPAGWKKFDTTFMTNPEDAHKIFIQIGHEKDSAKNLSLLHNSQAKLWFDFKSPDSSGTPWLNKSAPTISSDMESKYRSKIHYEVQKFFNHAKKWINEKLPGNGKQHTFHFTFSFKFENTITKHIQSWIKWLYYVIRQLELSYQAPTTSAGHTRNGTISTHEVAYYASNGGGALWDQSLFDLESETWVLIDGVSSGGLHIGSVTLTQDFDDLDDLGVGPWPGPGWVTNTNHGVASSFQVGGASANYSRDNMPAGSWGSFSPNFQVDIP